MSICEKNIDCRENVPLCIELMNITHCAPHYHPHELEIIFCMRGSVSVVSSFERVRLNTGGFFTVNRSEIHCIQSSDPDNAVMTVHLNLPALHSDAGDDSPESKLFTFESLNGKIKQSPLFDDALTLILLSAAVYAENPADMRLRTLAHNIIGILSDHFSYIDYVNDYQPYADNVRELSLKIMQYLYRNYRNKISLTSFAEENYFDRAHLAHLLKDKLHRTFNACLNYLRCVNAEFLLLTTDKSNEEISELCGFSDIKYFYSHFRSWYEKTPSRYRKEFYDLYDKPDDCISLERDEIPALAKDFLFRHFTEKTAAEFHC